jgi:hypothetical protein
MKSLSRFFWFFLLASLLGISGSALGNDAGTTTRVSKDAVLTQQVQQDFSNRVEFSNVTVAVDDRVALLQGSVETYREKMDAERLALKHHGIEGVRDFIAVQPVIPVSDQELRETIANRLRYDRIGYGITFNNFEVSVRDGVVTIAGDARSYRIRLPPLALSRTLLACVTCATKLAFCHSLNLMTSCACERLWRSTAILHSRNIRWIRKLPSALWLKAEM